MSTAGNFTNLQRYTDDPGFPVKVTYLEDDANSVDDAVTPYTRRPLSPPSTSSPVHTTKFWTRRKVLIMMWLFAFLVGLSLLVAGIVRRKQTRGDVNKAIVVGTTAPTNSPTTPTSIPMTTSTMTPTMMPTRSPTGAPTKSLAPSHLPSSAPTLTERMDRFVNIFSSVTDRTMFRQGTPQMRTLEWLAFLDAVNLEPEHDPEWELVQRYIVALVYFSANGVDWTNNYNFLSKNSVCTWNSGSDSQGVTCNSLGEVTGISLVDNNLIGSLEPEINHLGSLRTILLYHNQLSGPFPDLGLLLDLEHIDMDGNQFTGSLPESIFHLPSLEELLLLNMPGLTGTIPEIDASQSRLRRISFYNCSLSGPIPNSLGEVSGLTFLQFFDNDLTGSIPPAVTALPNLEVLAMRGNQLTGTIPPLSSNPTNLQTISLGENQLRGSLPDLDGLPSLQNLYLQGNLLSGSVPSGLNKLPSVENVWLFQNRFNGPLPTFGSNPGTVQQLYLHGNQFTGSMDSLLSEAPSSLQYLDVSDNALHGSMSEDVGRFSSLLYLNVSYCDLTGQVPMALGGLGLDSLSLQGNAIQGNLDSIFCPSSMAVLTSDCGGSSPQTICECCTECCIHDVFSPGLAVCSRN